MDGWDATAKVSALATVLTLAPAASAGVDYPLRPNDIAREGSRSLTMEQVQSAKMTLAPAIPAQRTAGLGAAVASAGVGRPYRLVCQAEKLLDGTVVGSAKPELVPIADDPLAGCDGATSIILFRMDVIHGLTLSEIHPDAVTTTYGPLAESLTIARG